MLNENSAAAARAEWLPAERLGQAKIEPGVRSYMIGKGLLTDRLKDVCGGLFSLRLMQQSTALLDPAQRAILQRNDSAALFREVKMYCREAVWVYAQSVIPDSTLNAHPWLAELGDASLGETLNAISGVERSSYEYAWLAAEHPLTARAFAGADINPSGLWARRYRFTLHGAPLLVQELFFPALGQI